MALTNKATEEKRTPEDFDIQYRPVLPSTTRPIVIIGAGGIVHDAHLPAYVLTNFPVYGIFDQVMAKAKKLATTFRIPHVFSSLEEAIALAPPDAVFDVALPAKAFPEILAHLPQKAAVLLQKPMGDDLVQAQEILSLCRQKDLMAGVNFQLRYAPYMLAAKDIIAKGWIGQVVDVEFNINVFTPWHLWQFMRELPRVEILYHSIHYIDFIRNVLGNPRDVLAKTTKHPSSPHLASVRSNIILDYGEQVRACIHTNHHHNFGLHNQHAYCKIEGTRGAIKVGLGLLMNYPEGVPDSFEFYAPHLSEAWQELKIPGSWFPDAFIGSMSEVMRFAEGSSNTLDNSVEDVIGTMQCVEAAYEVKVPSQYLHQSQTGHFSQR